MSAILVDTTAQPAAEPPVVFDREGAMANLRARVNAALVQEIENFTPEKIVQGIITQMRGAEREVTWKILGMDNRWGKWEIDHCNGRTSPLSSELASRCEPLLSDAIAEIGQKVVAEMTVDPKARGQLKAAFKKELQSKLDRLLREAVTDQATRLANTLVGGIVTEVRAEAGL